MTQAIVVKYLAPSATRGARLKATCYGGSLTLPREYEKDAQDQAADVAKALVQKMRWGGRYAGGYLPNGDWVFVNIASAGSPEDTGFAV